MEIVWCESFAWMKPEWPIQRKSHMSSFQP